MKPRDPGQTPAVAAFGRPQSTRGRVGTPGLFYFAWGCFRDFLFPALLLHCPRKPVGLHLCPDLRHIVPEHDDVVLPAVDVPDVVPEQRLRLEAEALEQRDRRLLVDRHLHRKLFQPRGQRDRECLLRQRPAHALSTDDTTIRISPT